MQSEFHISRIKYEDVKPIVKNHIDNHLPTIKYKREFVESDIKKPIFDFEIKKKISENGKHMDLKKYEDIDLKRDNKNHSSLTLKPEGFSHCFNGGEIFTKPGVTQISLNELKCNKCSAVYTNRSKFESHLRQHMPVAERKSLKKNKVKCLTCNAIITKPSLKRHLRLHTLKLPCNKCGLILKRDEMWAHQKIAHYNYTCQICNKVSKCREDHERHLQCHEKHKRNPCPECDASFQHLVVLARHVTLAHRNLEKGKFECLFCKKIVSAIGHHLRTHEKESHNCEKCGAVLPNYSAYKSHLRYHAILSSSGRDRAVVPKNLITKKPWVKCVKCDRQFRTENELKQHSLTHLAFSIYPCQYCESSDFESFSDLIQHVSRQHRYIPATFSQCPFCSNIVQDLEEHLLMHQIDKIECVICDTGFGILEFKTHYSRRHKLKKQKQTSLSVLMEKYLSMPLNFKKTICLYCHQKVRLSHIVSHRDSHQTFKCTMCKKIFFNRKLLTLHENRHLLASQKCPVCSRCFVSHIRLMAHLKMCHKLYFSASKSCPRCFRLR